MSTLYVNGTIHSTSDPYATAMLVDGGSVAWVGADDTAESMRARSANDWQVVDLDSALVIPAFVDSLTRPTTASGPDAGSSTSAAEAGVFLSIATERSAQTGTRTIGYRTIGSDEVPGSPSEAAALVAHRTAADTPTPTAGLTAVVGSGGLDAAATARLAEHATAAGVQIYFLPRDVDAFAVVVSALRATSEALGTAALGMARHRVSWNGPVAADALRTLAENSLSYTVVPDADGTITAPIASLLAEGVPVSFGSGAASPDLWAAVRASLEHVDAGQRISARSGFTAATKAGIRALPLSLGAEFPMAGRLAPSSPATFGIWAAEALSVQAPDGRVAAWSTDARAGTPLLPVLEDGTAAPQCLATVVDGTEVYRSADRV